MMEKPVPDWLLERMALGELPPDQLADLRARLDAEPGGAERLAALEASNRELLERHPPAAMAAAIRRRAERERARSSERAPWLRGLAIAAPVAALVLVLAVLPGGEGLGPSREGTASTRLKGQLPRLLAHRQVAGLPELLAEGATIRPRELLQLSYVAAGRGYGVILSLDGAGVVTLHHPLEGRLAAPLEQGGAVPLPHAYELDDAPGFERFILVSAEEPFPVQAVLDAAARLAKTQGAEGRAPLPLPADWEQTSFTLRKAR